MKTLYSDWETIARTCVAQLRMEAAKYPTDPRLTELVGELSVQDQHFRQWWGEHRVATRNIGTKTLRTPSQATSPSTGTPSPSAPTPTSNWSSGLPKQAPPSHDGLRILASWAADRHHSAAPTS